MNRLRYARKFALIAAVLIAPLIFVAVSFLSAQSRDVSFAQKEKVGLVYLKPVSQLLLGLTRARSAAVDTAAHTTPATPVAGAEAAVRSEVNAVDAAGPQAAALGLTTQWHHLKAQIASALASSASSPASALSTYGAVLTATEALMASDGNNSNMILDPDNDSYYLMDAVLNRLPLLIDVSGQVGDTETELAGSAPLSLAQRLNLEDIKGTIVNTLANSDPDYASALTNTHYRQARALLSGARSRSDAATNAILSQLTTTVTSGQPDGAAASDLATRAQADLLTLSQATFPVIDHLLDTRLAGFEDASHLTELVLIIGVLAAAYLFVCFYLATKTAVDRLSDAADGIARGDISQEMAVLSRDELGSMANAFARSIEYLTTMAGVASEIASGNLTVEVQRRSERDVLGHAFSEMKSRLVDLIGNIDDTSRTVSNASAQMAQTSQEASRAVDEIAGAMEAVAEGAETQVRTVAEARQLTESVKLATAASSREATAATEVATQARSVAQDGVVAMREATEAMDAVQATSTRVTGAMRHLGAQSEKIGSIVATITGIAEQTNLLALNAAIEAARAAEHGRGFAVVADEVRNLAEGSADAASSIARLVEEIRREIEQAVEIVETGERQAAEGVGTVSRARHALAEIDQSIQQMDDRVHHIATAISEIDSSGDLMSHRVAEITGAAEGSAAAAEQVSASTQQTSATTQQIAASARTLADSAEGLGQLIGQFTLS